MASPPLQFDRCEIDIVTRSLTRNGEGVAVQPKVLDLLVYLIEHRDRVVSSEELMNALWTGLAVTQSSVSRAVYKARLALGDHGEDPHSIATVRGSGFRFVAPLRFDALGPSEGDGADCVGRAFELAHLEALLERVLIGQGGLVYLSGERGIGKTRLASEFVKRALVHGAHGLLTHCPEDSDSAAYWPWRQLARGLSRERTLEELTQLAGPELADLARADPGLEQMVALEPPPELSAEEMRLRIFASAFTVLERLARERPLILVLDDLHLADLPSLAFLRFLSHSLSDVPVLVVGTFCEADIARDDERCQLLAEAERSASGEVLHLTALSLTEIAQLAEKQLGRPAPTGTLAALRALSGGNPFFLGELLRLVESQGDEVLSAQWPDGVNLPVTVRTAIAGQLGRLDPEERRILIAAAMLGGDVAADALVGAMDAAPETVLHCLERAVDAHLLERLEPGGNSFRFAHALLSEALREHL